MDEGSKIMGIYLVYVIGIALMNYVLWMAVKDVAPFWLLVLVSITSGVGLAALIIAQVIEDRRRKE